MWLCFNINFLFRWSDIGVSVRLQPLCYCSVTKLCLTPSLSPGACSNTSPLSRWCHPNISSSIVQLSSCPQSFPASQSFPLNRLFASGDQSTGASASASVLPMNIQGWFHFSLTSLTSLMSQDSQESSPAPQFESINSWVFSLLKRPVLILYMSTGKTIVLIIWAFVSKVMSLFFNMLSWFAMASSP